MMLYDADRGHTIAPSFHSSTAPVDPGALFLVAVATVAAARLGMIIPES